MSLRISLVVLLLSISAYSFGQMRDQQEELYQRVLVHESLDAVFEKHPMYEEVLANRLQNDFVPANRLFIVKNDLIGNNFELVKYEHLCEIVPVTSIVNFKIEHYLEFIQFLMNEDETKAKVSFVYRYPELFEYTNYALYGTMMFEKQEDGYWNIVDHRLHNNFYSLNLTK